MSNSFGEDMLKRYKLSVLNERVGQEMKSCSIATNFPSSEFWKKSGFSTECDCVYTALCHARSQRVVFWKIHNTFLEGEPYISDQYSGLHEESYSLRRILVSYFTLNLLK